MSIFKELNPHDIEQTLKILLPAEIIFDGEALYPGKLIANLFSLGATLDIKRGRIFPVDQDSFNRIRASLTLGHLTFEYRTAFHMRAVPICPYCWEYVLVGDQILYCPNPACKLFLGGNKHV